VEKVRDYKNKLRQVITTKSFFAKTHHLFRTVDPSATQPRKVDELQVEALSVSLV